MATKQGILNFLENRLNGTAKGSIKYYTIGALWILVNKDIITVADIESRFPELV